MSAQHDASRMFDVGGVAFDLDGTLLDTVHDLAAAVNELLTGRGHAPLPKERIQSFVGKGMANLVRRVLGAVHGVAPETIGDDEVDAALAIYQSHYHALLGSETQIYDGVEEGLMRLKAMGIPLAVITNKASRFVLPHLEQAGLASYFDVVLGADDVPRPKPHPEPLLHVARAFGIPPRQLLMVGDSVNDAQAARAAGCPVLIVPYGYNEGRPVAELDADGIVPSLAAVADRVRAVPKS